MIPDSGSSSRPHPGAHGTTSSTMATGPQLLVPGMMTPEQRYMLDTFGFLHTDTGGQQAPRRRPVTHPGDHQRRPGNPKKTPKSSQKANGHPTDNPRTRIRTAKVTNDDFPSAFMRVKLENDDSTAEWRWRHS